MNELKKELKACDEWTDKQRRDLSCLAEYLNEMSKTFTAWEVKTVKFDNGLVIEFNNGGTIILPTTDLDGLEMNELDMLKKFVRVLQNR